MVHFTFRIAKPEDLDLYFNWANDPIVRSNAVNSELISYDNHINWFKEKLSDPNCYMYIALCNDEIFGQIRFDIKGDVAEIDFSVDQNFRGKGLGNKLLEMGSNVFNEDTGGKYLLKGIVKKANSASNKAFRKSGYSEQSAADNIKSEYTYFIKKCL